MLYYTYDVTSIYIFKLISNFTNAIMTVVLNYSVNETNQMFSVTRNIIALILLKHILSHNIFIIKHIINIYYYNI